MTEVLTTDVAAHQPQIQEHTAIPAERETFLRQVLDGPYAPHNYGNYEHAMDSGLIDEFYYSPEEDIDGIAHILTGNIKQTSEGAIRPEGFHHEPSGAYLAAGETPSTVDRSHIAGRSSNERRRYKERPFEPYVARVAVGGLQKVGVHRAEGSDEVEIHPLNNAMFPKEYDALAVLKTAVMAKNLRDQSKDEINSNGWVTNTAEVPLLDGKATMPVALCLDAKTGKIITAYPRVNMGGRMNLSEEDLKYHLFGDSASVSQGNAQR
jgi:hypothetical protein